MATEPIYFYSASDYPYGCFSNFSPHGFTLDGTYWRTSEHYFQAMKFKNSPKDMADVARANTPKLAAHIGRDRKRPLRRDWESVKDAVMRRGLGILPRPHADIRAILLATGDVPLVENSPIDDYWGCGADGSGQNKLGQILMEVRTTLRGN